MFLPAFGSGQAFDAAVFSLLESFFPDIVYFCIATRASSAIAACLCRRVISSFQTWSPWRSERERASPVFLVLSRRRRRHSIHLRWIFPTFFASTAFEAVATFLFVFFFLRAQRENNTAGRTPGESLGRTKKENAVFVWIYICRRVCKYGARICLGGS